MRRLPLLLAATGLVLTACGPTSSSAVPACCAPPDDTRVTGVLVGVGGPIGAPSRHWRGTISTHGPWLTTVHTDAHGRFELELPHGDYRFTGTSSQYDGARATCTAPGLVHLQAHRTTHVRVLCQVR